MGRVKIDTHAGEYEWYPVSLSDVDSIRGLLKYRYQFDLLFDRSHDVLQESNADIGDMLETVICLYVDLDRMIERCNFTKRQMQILEMYMSGYTEEDIAEILNIQPKAVNGILNSICRKIKRQNDLTWKYDYIYWSKVKTPDNWKQCSRCGEWKPATEEFFRKRSDDKGDGFYNYCRKCETNLKNIK